MRYIYFLFVLFLLMSCNEQRLDSPLSLFKDQIIPEEVLYEIPEDSLIHIYRLYSNDSYLVIFEDGLDGYFSLFDFPSGNFICRFGKIGQGPGEILQGTEGYLSTENKFYTFHFATGNISKYNVDSLSIYCDFKSISLSKNRIGDRLYQIIPLCDSLFLGAGCYESTKQFVLYDKSGQIIDSKVNIFNFDDERSNDSHKSLSNQGILRKHPSKDLFAWIVFNSGNLDIIEVKNNRIEPVKLLRLRNPLYTSVSEGRYMSVNQDLDSPIGYLDIASGENYIYTLYTDKKWVENGVGNQRNSDLILVFDWNGNPIKKYKLNHDVYNITVNEKMNRLYGSFINSEGGWSITSYDLNDL